MLVDDKSEGKDDQKIASSEILNRKFDNMSSNFNAPSVNSITEEEMLETAEQILNQLAKILASNGWTVNAVFGHPDIIETLPKVEDDVDVKVLSARNFLGRVY